MARRLAQITLEPSVLTWARQRADLSQTDLAKKLQVSVQAVAGWESTGGISTAKVDALARVTHTPPGYLYLEEPPDETLPIADFRSRDQDRLQRPSPDLLETVYLMQRRQMWMIEELLHQQELPLPFVGEYSLDAEPSSVASAIAGELGLSDGWASIQRTWTQALDELKERVASSGILLVFNGVVGNDTHRQLDTNEFQGFTLVDPYVPLIFINNADYKTAQIFTLAHELAHVFLGATGLSRIERLSASDNLTERQCDRIAAEFLVPEGEFRDVWNNSTGISQRYDAIAKHFKVSSVMAARRAFDIGFIEWQEFEEFYEGYKRANWGGQRKEDSKGGNFWYTQRGRIGQRFATAIVRAVGEGRLSYTEACRLTGLKGSTFDSMSASMELPL